ncbi:hypothetical protein GC197_03045 [bacterium]|nr:hypothetical protein [bacterium]
MPPKPSQTEALAIEKLYRLMYLAFLDIRSEGAQLNSGPVYGLANLFHGIPPQLEKAAQGEMTYEEVMRSLLDKARELKCEAWIHNQYPPGPDETQS